MCQESQVCWAVASDSYRVAVLKGKININKKSATASPAANAQSRWQRHRLRIAITHNGASI